LKSIIVIGSGFASLSVATHLAHNGYSVTVVEKNDKPGGRANSFKEAGFTFDMGPSWYWMPDVFERYFGLFNKKVSDYYTLTRLDPSYTIYFEKDVWNIPANYSDLKTLFESVEKGSALQLDTFIKEAAYKYEVGINKLVYKPSLRLHEFIDKDLIKGVFKLDVFKSTQKHVRSLFKHSYIRNMLEFPVIFLGGTAKNIPALYTLMNYADIIGGTWYPMGGMYNIVEGMYALAKEKGVTFIFNEPVQKIITNNNIATEVVTHKQHYKADVIISGADYEHTEQQLLQEDVRNYNPAYWDKRVMAPSSLLYYVGISKKIKSLTHHSLFFDVPFDDHAEELYTTKQWPNKPLFYVGAPSVTDSSVAPENYENLFFLIPVTAGLQGDTEEIRKKYFDIIFERFEKHMKEDLKKHIVFYKSFGISNFVDDYNSFKGNAYGLANTLKQTAILKPSIKNKSVENLFYTGQLSVPGPGVPPSLISGEVVANEVVKYFENKNQT
jgi:phytoene desaturase